MDKDHALYKLVKTQEVHLAAIEEKVLETAIATDSFDKDTCGE